jgi:pimeloyl-ACP methyl ester carboxylesterase
MNATEPETATATAADHRTVELPQGTIRYRDLGTGEPIVFVHGYLVDGRLWDGPADRLRRDFRCIVPDWPMGSHTIPMKPDADLSPAGVARIIADFLAALQLEKVTIVGNDSGGAISQVLVTRHPERIGRLVLTNCDTEENFPPAPFGVLTKLARIPGAMAAMGLPFRIGAVRRATFAPFAKRPIPDELSASWMDPGTSDKGIQRDLRKFTAGIDKRYTLEAAEGLRSFKAPVRFAWAPEDRFFKLERAERLAAMIPDARIETIPDAKTFVALDQPERLAEVITAFMREPVRTEAA